MSSGEKSTTTADGARLAAVLIVEDEPVIRLALSDHLQEANFKVFEARSTKEAIEILEDTGRVIDLVFVDVQLPGVINGLGLATWVKGKRPDIGVVLTSGYPEKAKSAAELFENAPFVQKPYDFAQVVKTLRATLARAA